MTIAELARPELRALQPYEAAQQVDDTIRLNANEAPWSSGADRFRRPLNRYPEIRPARLARALGDYFACDPARLLVTRGTSEAIDLLIRGAKSVQREAKKKAKRYKMTPMIGRSHGVHAEPITFGLKMALMADEFSRVLGAGVTVRRRCRVTKACLDPQPDRICRVICA